MSDAGKGFSPGRLWSLWEIMRKFDATKLVAGITMTATLAQAISMLLRDKPKNGVFLPVEHIAELKEKLLWIAESADNLGLTATLITTQNLLAAIERGFEGDGERKGAIGFRNQDAGRLDALCSELSGRVRDELSARTLLAIAADRRKYYEPPEPLFGEAVQTAFGQDAADELVEAGNCLAVGQNTASVFHLMRLMEIALRKLGQEINATIVDKDGVHLQWRVILNNMNDKIKKMDRGEVQNKWAESYALLDHVGKAWRNDTMHPNKSYDEKQALAVFNAVESFMRDLAPLVL
jgi:hypothetical protein